MRKLLLVILLLPFCGSAQNTYKFFIHFTDKNNSSYSLNSPSSFLSARSIIRRANQSVPLDSTDLPVNQWYIDSVFSKGARIYTRSKWFNGVTVQCDSTQLNSILTLPFVSGAKKVVKTSSIISTKLEQSEPSVIRGVAPHISTLDYGTGYNQIHMMNGEYLHDAGYSGAGMLIALLDAGFFQADQVTFYQNLRNRNGIVATWDFVADEASVYEDDTHGEEVLSTIAAYGPGQMIGTAPDADFLLLRTEDAPTENIIEEYNWVSGAEYADSAGADVISSSLGYTEFDDTLASHTYADMNGSTCPSSIGADIAFSKGMLVCVSAGNQGGSLWHYISAPSDGNNVIAVGAVDSTGAYVSFSSVGPSSDGDVKPNVAAQGRQSAVVDPSSFVGTSSGTSFSCPILAGAATCLWQSFPMKTNTEIKTAIEMSASIHLAPDDFIGYGIPDFRVAGFYLNTGQLANARNNLISVYPNPFSDHFILKLYSEKDTYITVRLFNAQGKLVIEEQASVSPGIINGVAFSCPQLSSGFYMLEVMIGNSIFTQKIVR